MILTIVLVRRRKVSLRVLFHDGFAVLGALSAFGSAVHLPTCLPAYTICIPTDLAAAGALPPLDNSQITSPFLSRTAAATAAIISGWITHEFLVPYEDGMIVFKDAGLSK